MTHQSTNAGVGIPTPEGVLAQSGTTAVSGALLPRHWEDAYGYQRLRGTHRPARWICAYWQPAGGAWLDDGSFSGTADKRWFEWLVGHFNEVIQQALVSVGARPWALGDDEGTATHCLLLDLEGRGIYIAPVRVAGLLLLHQHPQVEPVEFSESALAAWSEQVEAAWQEQERQRQEMALVMHVACGNGYIVAADGGLDPCPTCEGQNAWYASVEAVSEWEGREGYVVFLPDGRIREAAGGDEGWLEELEAELDTEGNSTP